MRRMRATEDGKVSRASSSTLPRSLVIRVTRDRLRVTIESISQLRTVRYLNPYYVVLPGKKSRNFQVASQHPLRRIQTHTGGSVGREEELQDGAPRRARPDAGLAASAGAGRCARGNDRPRVPSPRDRGRHRGVQALVRKTLGGAPEEHRRHREVLRGGAQEERAEIRGGDRGHQEDCGGGRGRAPVAVRGTQEPEEAARGAGECPPEKKQNPSISIRHRRA